MWWEEDTGDPIDAYQRVGAPQMSSYPISVLAGYSILPREIYPPRDLSEVVPDWYLGIIQCDPSPFFCPTANVLLPFTLSYPMLRRSNAPSLRPRTFILDKQHGFTC